MSKYSGADTASKARETLSGALEALQKEKDVPQDVLQVTEHIAQSVGALFEAERASTERDGRSCVKSSLGFLSQTLALLQDARDSHKGIGVAADVIAKAMSALYPLTSRPSVPPPKPKDGAPVPTSVRLANGQGETKLEANIGATTESNFFVGFSGEISEGGVFIASYDTLPVGSSTHLLVTLPGGFEMNVQGTVKFVRDPLDMMAEAEPGMGVAFNALDDKDRELILRFIRKRAPMFYDD